MTRPLGGPFGALGGPKSIEITLVLCGFGPQRGPRRTPRTDSKNCKMDSVGRLKPRGPKWSGMGARAPPGPPLGPPKGPPTIDTFGFGHVLKTASLKMYGFPNEIHGFLKSTKNLHVAPGSVVHPFFRRPWEPRGGPGPPFGIWRRFLGGLGPPRGPFSEMGGPRRGPRDALLTSGRSFWSFWATQK